MVQLLNVYKPGSRTLFNLVKAQIRLSSLLIAKKAVNPCAGSRDASDLDLVGQAVDVNCALGALALAVACQGGMAAGVRVASDNERKTSPASRKQAQSHPHACQGSTTSGPQWPSRATKAIFNSDW